MTLTPTQRAQLRRMDAEEAIEAAYRMGLEAAAALVEALHAHISDPLIIGEDRADAGHNTLNACAKKIRALPTGEQE